MNDYVDPIVAHAEAVRKWPIMMDGEQSKPLFILGHSMGGLITLFTVFKMESLFKVQFHLRIILTFSSMDLGSTR